MVTEPRNLRTEIEQCLITWVHSRCDIEELQRLNTPGAMVALLLVFRIMGLGETARTIMDSLERDIEAGALDARPVVEAINLAVRRRNTRLGCDGAGTDVVPGEGDDEEWRPSPWDTATSLGSYLEITWFARRASDRLLRMQSSRGATLAMWLVQRLYAAGDPLAEVMRTVGDDDLPELFAALDSALTDYPDKQAKRLSSP